jgi:hypothetical protein
MQPLKAFAILLSASLLTPAVALLPAAPVMAAQSKAMKPGNVQARAKPSVNKPAARPAGNYGGGKSSAGNRNAGNLNTGNRNPGNRGVSNETAYKAGKAAGNRNQRDVVVVNNGRPGNGYYDNGRYYGPGYYEDDDNDFLEFVGKTAAVTAGVAAVSAVIGSVVKDKPKGDDCTETIQNGVPYVNCNGTWYQAVSQGYQVVPPPGAS